jgi:hypothetical protein
LQLGRLVNQAQQARIGQAVMDIPPLPAGDYEAGFPQHHQVLGQVRLAPPEGGFEVTDTRLLLPDRHEDLQTSSRSNGLKQVGDRLNGRYIHNLEYIITANELLSVLNVIPLLKRCHQRSTGESSGRSVLPYCCGDLELNRPGSLVQLIQIMRDLEKSARIFNYPSFISVIRSNLKERSSSRKWQWADM